MMETVHPNGTVSRLVSKYKNCEGRFEGRLCPDWHKNGMYNQLHLSGSYIENSGHDKTNLKFSFIKCVNTPENGNHCETE